LRTAGVTPIVARLARATEHPRASFPSAEVQMHKEFIAFLKEYSVIGLAIAVIIGGKLNDLVKACVDGILMPIVMFAAPAGNWREWAFNIGPVKFLLGPVLGASIDFLIVALIVFYMSKWILREAVVTKK
jgi:large conductance mechanosensitive channel